MLVLETPSEPATRIERTKITIDNSTSEKAFFECLLCIDLEEEFLIDKQVTLANIAVYFLNNKKIYFVSNNIVNLNQIKNLKKVKMIILIAIISAILSVIIWKNFVQDPADNLQIPESDNITFNQPKPIAPSDILTQIDNNAGKPILLYIYTTWCPICKHQLPNINEMARKFQNSDLRVIAVAIDRNIDSTTLMTYLDKFKNVYFEPQYLVYNDGLANFLAQKNIKYNKIIPLTVLIDRKGEVDIRFTGYKREGYLNRKIIKLLMSE